MSAPHGSLDPKEERRIRRWLSTTAGMERFLDRFVGIGKWIYDQDTDCWVFRDDRLHDGPGRCYVVMRRGGDWHTHVSPDEVVS